MPVSATPPGGDADIGSISVIIPTHNRRDMLGRSIGSVLAQTRLPLEIIVVNDNGVAVDDIIAAHNASGIVRGVTHATNQGASAARNTGLRMARGAYIAYLDDDDVYLPTHLESTVGALQASDCLFGYALAEYVIDDMRNGELVNVGRVQPYSNVAYSRERLMISNFIPTPTWVFARALLEQVGYFDEYFAACEDWEWLIRAAAATDFLAVPALTVEVRQRLHDAGHLIVQHGPKMNMWIRAVYAKHPVAAPQLQLARHEHLACGAARQLNAEQEAGIAAAFAAAAAGTLELINLINIGEQLEGANLRHRSVALYRCWLEHKPGAALRHAACFNLAVTLHNLQQYADAEAAYRLALQAFPRFHPARLQLAALLERRGSVDEALELWRAVVREEADPAAAERQQAAAQLARFLTLA
ncbi:glycosyltransferase involved in cell wall biosynthesis [Janthinobacterium sp. CG_23.3]|uniref:glycosyltransferase n=1 Tax=Janthinobacterium sp. CG_23.3 TaxID=3349634 RepID=UPI0038D43496